MNIIGMIGAAFIPLFILIIILAALYKRIDAFSLFVEGGKEGIHLAFQLLPFILGMLVAITILRSSGALDAFIQLITPLLVFLHIPADIVPLAFIRPISGTAALTMVMDITKTYGADSFIARLAATMQGSTDTTFYILTIYFGAVGITKIRYAWKVGLLADLVGIIVSILIVSLLFGS